MITTTLFQSCKKEISAKPKRIKIKHKTYRELLGLDRPKKQIFVQSDDENDDFLQKLLKEQAKQKNKGKHSLRNSPSKKGSKQLSKNNTSIKKTVKKRQNSNGSQQRQNRTQSNSEEKNNKIQRVDQQKKQTIQQKRIQQKKIQQEIKKPNQQKILIKPPAKNIPSNRSKPVSAVKSQIQNAIKVDQSNEPPYIATNKLVQTLRSQPKKQSQSLRQFRKTRHEAFSSTPISIKASINPQLRTISHNFSQSIQHPQFKALPLSTHKLLKMTNTDSLDLTTSKKQRFTHLNQKLFKSQEEEQRFLASLKSIKTKKYSIQPSLLTNL